MLPQCYHNIAQNNGMWQKTSNVVLRLYKRLFGFIRRTSGSGIIICSVCVSAYFWFADWRYFCFYFDAHQFIAYKSQWYSAKRHRKQVRIIAIVIIWQLVCYRAYVMPFVRFINSINVDRKDDVITEKTWIKRINNGETCYHTIAQNNGITTRIKWIERNMQHLLAPKTRWSTTLTIMMASVIGALIFQICFLFHHIFNYFVFCICVRVNK